MLALHIAGQLGDDEVHRLEVLVSARVHLGALLLDVEHVRQGVVAGGQRNHAVVSTQVSNASGWRS